MSGLSILIIDDDRATHDVVGEYLRVAGFHVAHAWDGPEGLASASASPPDLVLLDIQMPGIDGFEVLERLHRSPESSDVPVLLLSSLGQPSLKVRGLELGADDYVVKPFHRAELLARVKVAVRKSRRFRRAASVVDGRTEDIPLSLMLQTLEMSGKSARIQLPALDADVAIASGSRIDARFRGFRGIDALRRIVLLERGRLIVVFDDTIQPSEDAIAARDVLIGTYVYVDELRAQLGDVDGSQDMIAPGAAAWPVEASSPVFDVLAAMPGDIKASAARLLDAVRSGEVVLKRPIQAKTR